MSFGGVDHYQPHGVVDHAEYRQFAIDPIDGLTSQNIHLHRGLEMTQVCLDLPAAAVEFGYGLPGVSLGIDQRGHERDLA